MAYFVVYLNNNYIRRFNDIIKNIRISITNNTNDITCWLFWLCNW